MSDVPGSDDGSFNDPLSPSADPSIPSNDPTIVMPVTPGLQPTAGAAMGVGGPQFDEYEVVEQPWYRKSGAQILIAVGALLLLGLGSFLLLSNDSDAVVTTDVNDSVQLEILRMTLTEEAVPATLTATVSGPPARPAEYRWILPGDTPAPQPAVGTTDGAGRLKFAWAPIAAPADDSAWSSTVTLDEVLPPNATLTAPSYECVLERGDVTLNVTVTAEISPEPVTEPRTVRYSFGSVEFVTGDSLICPILSGDPNSETTTTVLTESSTTLAAATTVPATTAVPTTLPPVTTAPPPEVTTTTAAATTTTTIAATSTTTVAIKTTVVELIEGRDDLTAFAAAITTSGLRDQLNAQDSVVTIVAPNDTAVAELLASPNPPDLTDSVSAQAFVLAHVKSGEVLTSTDLSMLTEITFDDRVNRAVVVTGSTITIGGAEVIDPPDATADTGVVHTLDRTLITPEP